MGAGRGLIHKHSLRSLALGVHPNLSFLLSVVSILALPHPNKASANEAVGVGAAGFIFGLDFVVLVLCSLRKEESYDGFLGNTSSHKTEKGIRKYVKLCNKRTYLFKLSLFI